MVGIQTFLSFSFFEWLNNFIYKRYGVGSDISENCPLQILLLLPLLYFAFHKNPGHSLNLPHLKDRFCVMLVILSPGIENLIKLMETILFSLTVIVFIWWFSWSHFIESCSGTWHPGKHSERRKAFLHGSGELEQGEEILVRCLWNDFRIVVFLMASLWC